MLFVRVSMLPAHLHFSRYWPIFTKFGTNMTHVEATHTHTEVSCKSDLPENKMFWIRRDIIDIQNTLESQNYVWYNTLGKYVNIWGYGWPSLR